VYEVRAERSGHTFTRGDHWAILERALHNQVNPRCGSSKAPAASVRRRSSSATSSSRRPSCATASDERDGRTILVSQNHPVDDFVTEVEAMDLVEDERYPGRVMSGRS